MARAQSVPLDVILIVLAYTDQSELYQLSIVSKRVSVHALQQLWSMPYISTMESLCYLTRTLASPNTKYPYKDWISSLAVHFEQDYEEYNSNYYQAITDEEIFLQLSQLELELFSLQNIHVTTDNIPLLEKLISIQLKQGMAELQVYQCTSMAVIAILNSLQESKNEHLRKLCFHDCSLTDHQVENVVQYCPDLRTLKLDRCGCLSDSSMIAIAENCKELDTLLVTLPPSIIQANTITSRTIDALEINCLSLKKFICGGQLRIQEYIKCSRQHQPQCDMHFNKALVIDPSSSLLSSPPSPSSPSSQV